MTNPQSSTPKTLAGNLVRWFEANHRQLPWRQDRDPYRIWISEIMLQQTTVAAVIPYYERFLKAFPSLKALAKAPLSEVLQRWTGLGYYSRARNLHAAAQILAKTGFPETHQELMELPGLGPYTARAIASLAFGESVGVLDGNVIRILSRVYGKKFEHWTPKDRNRLQVLADELAQHETSHQVNQAMMELGATVCTSKAYQCLTCPWFDPCVARKKQTADQLPLMKPRKSIEVWVWRPLVLRRGSQVALIENNYAPFLKRQWIFPGEVEKAQRPKEFDLRHGITHHDIYVLSSNRPQKRKKLQAAKSPKAGRSNTRNSKAIIENLGSEKLKWVPIKNLTEWNPSILLKKVLDLSDL